ncbi:MAG TPA: MotE family protein [Rhizomicrobium sp.]|nr:MotE family protein [Rhizomicrobium sp.]
MNLRPLLNNIRLLPVLMGACGLLLTMKAVGISEYAYAEATSVAAAAPAPAEAPKPKHDIAEDKESSSSSEVDLLTNLSKRRSELDTRATELTMRENLIAAAEKRVDEKIATLKQLQDQIQKLVAQRDAEQEKQIASLVKTYSAMKPADAARIFDGLDDEILVPVASLMKPDVLAPVLAKMNPASAQKLTIKLANRLNLPDAKPVTVASNDQPAPQPQPNATIAPPSANLPITTTPTPSAAPAQGKTGG